MKFTLVSLLLAASFISAAEPVLVGHWKLDDKSGDVAVDSGPAKNHAKAFESPSRVAGKTGGAFGFDGKKQYIEIPNSAQLEKIQLCSYSISAWFKADNVPAGQEDANDAQYAIVIRTGFHEGLTYGGDKKFMFTHWIKGTPDPAWSGINTGDSDYEAGQWHHVVGVVDDDAKVSRIYVDGELKGTSEEWAATATAHDFGQMTWKIGAGLPGADHWAWHAKAAIQDVRIYSGALNDSQVKALYDASAAGK